jgi:hypothetical protein
MALNTRIRGAQIKLDDVSLDVATDSFAFYDATDGVIKRDLISDFVTAIAGDGLTASSGVMSVEVDNVSLGFATGGILGVLAGGISDEMLVEDYVKVSDIDGVTLEVITGGIVQIADGGVDASKLSATGGSAGQVLTKGTGDTLSWATPSAITEDYIQEAEIVTENHSADILETGFAGIVELGFAPVLGSVQVFLNGLLQEEGSGKDYTIGGTGNKIVTFDTAPVIDDIVIIHYIKN